jgi:hypothetical protein
MLQINYKKDKLVEKLYNESMQELDKFFKINWTINTPVLIIVPDRRKFDEIYNKKTENWLVGWNTGKFIFILDRKNFEKESCHKYSKENYKKLIKHELCHSFCDALSYRKFYPMWFSEGVAIYLSGQIKEKMRPKKFKDFLRFYNKIEKEMYNESGFVVELLIKKFGREKIINLIKALNNVNSEKDFEKEFKKIYKFDLNYKNVNKIYTK